MDQAVRTNTTIVKRLVSYLELSGQLLLGSFPMFLKPDNVTLQFSGPSPPVSMGHGRPSFYDIEYTAGHDVMAYFSHMISRTYLQFLVWCVWFACLLAHLMACLLPHLLACLPACILSLHACFVWHAPGNRWICLRTALGPVYSSWPLGVAFGRTLRAFRAFAEAKGGPSCDCQETGGGWAGGGGGLGGGAGWGGCQAAARGWGAGEAERPRNPVWLAHQTW